MDTDKLKALALAATPGKWEVDTIKSDGHYGTDEDGGYGYTAYVVTDEMGRPLMDSLNRDDSEIHEEYSDEEHYAWDELAKRDAAYIAAACPATMLELIAERDELRAEVERLRTELAAGAARQGGNTTKEGGLFSDPKYAQGLADSRFAVGLSGAAPAAGTEKDAERYRALRHLMQSAKGSASLEVNQHLAYYEPAEPGQEVKLQWYPDTPIGFYTIEGATLDDVADEAIEFIEAHTKAGKDQP